jgi:RNA polymerase sigma-70 factor (ECF subfamily)
MAETDRELILISKGNELALQHFMRKHSERMYFQAYGMLGDKESAEEVVSDVFLEVWSHRKSLGEIDNVNAWLSTIVYHKVISLMRKTSKKKLEINIDDFPNFEFPHMLTPMDSMISEEEVNSLHEAIEGLPLKCKRIFYMAKIDQMPYAEICKLTGITLATVNYHIAYAMSALKKKLLGRRDGDRTKDEKIVPMTGNY